MKFGRIVPQVNTHRLVDTSYFQHRGQETRSCCT